MKKIKFGNKVIGTGEPLYFIADIGANHDGDINRAYRLIELAKEAGADAAKFQNVQASKIVSKVGFEKVVLYKIWGSGNKRTSTFKKQPIFFYNTIIT